MLTAQLSEEEAFRMLSEVKIIDFHIRGENDIEYYWTSMMMGNKFLNKIQIGKYSNVWPRLLQLDDIDQRSNMLKIRNYIESGLLYLGKLHLKVIGKQLL